MTDIDPLTAAHAENALLTEELAYWKDLYQSYCKPEDVAVLETCRDEAVRRADAAEAAMTGLVLENARMYALVRERSDWAQRVWLAWCSARERARRVEGRA